MKRRKRVLATERKSVAILPFKNLSNDPETAFYEFSLGDAVITDLARVRSLVVRPSSAIVKYQGKQFDPEEAGREMSVDAILTASFLRAGDRLRVTAQLLDVRTGEILWSERIDADASDIIAVQDTMVQQIVEGLRLELSPEEKVELGKGSTSDAAASEEYLRGRNCLGQFIYHTVAREHDRFGNRALPARHPARSEFCACLFRTGRLLRQSRAQGTWRSWRSRESREGV